MKCDGCGKEFDESVLIETPGGDFLCDKCAQEEDDESIKIPTVSGDPKMGEFMAAFAKHLEEGVDDQIAAPGHDEMKYPIEVKSIKFYKQKDPNKAACPTGTYVSVRPCSDNPDNKTFLGVMMGDFPLSPIVSWRPATGVMSFTMQDNPAIFVPDQGRIVWGSGSWWGRIESPEQLREITDADINSAWYVRALKEMFNKEVEEGQAEEPIGHCGVVLRFEGRVTNTTLDKFLLVQEFDAEYSHEIRQAIKDVGAVSGGGGASPEWSLERVDEGPSS